MEADRRLVNSQRMFDRMRRDGLDALVARFGVGNVAEISGRTHRFEGDKYVRRKLDGVSPNRRRFS